MALPTKTPVFISFDYDHDAALKEFLVGQAKNDNSPFFIQDWSLRKETKRWKADAKKRIQRSKVVIVICGRHTTRLLVSWLRFRSPEKLGCSMSCCGATRTARWSVLTERRGSLTRCMTGRGTTFEN